MPYRVEITRAARAEAREAYLWMHEHSPEAAARWYNGLEEAIDTLRTHPRRCPLAPEAAFFGQEIRQLLYGRRRSVYRILFEISEDERTVHIVHVVHGARDNLRPDHSGDEDEHGV
jgi:plasmid stabilization system protein ParE